MRRFTPVLILMGLVMAGPACRAESRLNVAPAVDFYGESTTGPGLQPTAMFVTRGGLRLLDAPVAEREAMTAKPVPQPSSLSNPRSIPQPYILAGHDSATGTFAGAGAASHFQRTQETGPFDGAVRVEYRHYGEATDQWLIAGSGEIAPEGRIRLFGDFWGSRIKSKATQSGSANSIAIATDSASLQIRAAADIVRHSGWLLGGGAGNRWTSWGQSELFLFGEVRVSLSLPAMTRLSDAHTPTTWVALLGKSPIPGNRSPVSASSEWTVAIGGAM